MKFVERRTYELREGEWIEHGERDSRTLIERIVALAATALAIALITAIGIVAAGLALVLLPIALLATWAIRSASTFRSRRPS